MSMTLLSNVFQEARRLAIAGSGLAQGDFRIKKLIDPLKKAGMKSPVLAKVAQAINGVVEADGKNASTALLELSALVTAILYTQGNTGIDGPLKAIETSNLEISTAPASARVLKPLIEALTTKGSGRHEIIVEAHKRGAFKDLRLVKPAVDAIDDVYPEIGEFLVQEVLPTYGTAIVPELRKKFDVKGRGGHVRRLLLLHKLDPVGTHEFVEQALESGSKEMKLAAISCLKGSKDHLSFLLEQTRSKVKDVRQAAYEALAESKGQEVVNALLKALSGADVEIAAGPASANPSPQVLAFVLENGREQLGELFTVKDKAKLSKALSRFHQFLGALTNRSDKQSVKFLLDCFEKRSDIAALKGKDENGEKVNRRVAALIVRSGSKDAQGTLADAHGSAPTEMFHACLIAAMRTWTAAQVYKQFSPYYTAKIPKGRGNNEAKLKRDIVSKALDDLAQDEGHDFDYFGAFDDELRSSTLLKGVKLDPHWLDDAVKQEDLDLVCALAHAKHKAALRLMSHSLNSALAKKGSRSDWQHAEVLRTMIRIGHPEAVETYIKCLQVWGKPTGTRAYHLWTLPQMAEDLPKSAAPQLEAVLPGLHEGLVDSILPHLEALKAK